MTGELHERGLEPIDADRLLVARLVVHPDVDVVARLEHLLGRLDEAGFVAIDRRDCRRYRAGSRQGRGWRERRPLSCAFLLPTTRARVKALSSKMGMSRVKTCCRDICRPVRALYALDQLREATPRSAQSYPRPRARPVPLVKGALELLVGPVHCVGGRKRDLEMAVSEGELQLGSLDLHALHPGEIERRGKARSIRSRIAVNQDRLLRGPHERYQFRLRGSSTVPDLPTCGNRRALFRVSWPRPSRPRTSLFPAFVPRRLKIVFIPYRASISAIDRGLGCAER